MKYKDYYAIMGLERGASAEDIKKAYRRLARKYHPDVSKEADAEERFKEVSEAYETLRDPEKRAAYDQLGRHAAGQDFQPPPDWGQAFGAGGGGFEDIDLGDLFAGLTGHRRHGGGRSHGFAMPGRDLEALVRLTFDQAFHGTEIELDLSLPEMHEDGSVRRVPRNIKVRVPKGVTDGQKLRVPGKGGKGVNGGPDGDLYLDIEVARHRHFRVEGSDLYLDLPLAPWEAVLGTQVHMPTPTGAISLRIPPNTRAGQRFRVGGRGLARANDKAGDLYAVVQIAVPTVVTDRERELYRQLAEQATFNPRAHLETGGSA